MNQKKKKQHEAQLTNYVLSGFHESLNQKEKEKDVLIIVAASSAFMA